MTADTSPRLTPQVSERDHAEGDAQARVTRVEYGDYECPHCGRAYPIVKEVQRRLGPRLRFVFRNFPLEQVHPHAEHAAEAAETADAQGKFWAMHDALFENQDTLDDESLLGLAERLGLDTAAFEVEMTEHRYAPRVREDFVSGVRSGVNGTPTFFINGVRFDDSWDADTLTEALEKSANTPA